MAIPNKSITAAGKGTNWANIKPGLHQAVILAVGYLPDQEKEFAGEKKVVDELFIVYQSDKVLKDENGVVDEKGRCYQWSRSYKLSTHEKAGLVKDLSFLVPPNSEFELTNLIATLVGARVAVMCENKASKADPTKFYSSIKAIMEGDDEVAFTAPQVDLPKWACEKWADYDLVALGKGECQFKDFLEGGSNAHPTKQVTRLD